MLPSLILGYLMATAPCGSNSDAAKAIGCLVNAPSSALHKCGSPADSIERLAAAGASAVPQIREALGKADVVAKQRLIEAASRIGGTSAERLLLDAVVQYEGAPRAYALGCLLNGPNLAGKRLEIRESDMQALLAILSEGTPPTAFQVARLMSRNYSGRGEHVKAIAARLVADASRSLVLYGNAVEHHSLVSVGAGMLDALIACLEAMDRSLAREALRQHLQSNRSDRAREILLVALGRLGDKQVAGDLLVLVNNTATDCSTRWLALRAYARLLGPKATPVLNQFVHDSTPGPNPRYFPLREAAKSELAKMWKLDQGSVGH